MSVKQWFEKIVFKNNSLPAVNGDSLNNIQDLINKAIDDAYIQATSKGLPIGTVLEYYGTVAPENYMFANGQAISRTDFSELYELIGTICGAGDNSTTFNLPDRRECLGIGYKEGSTNFGALGKKGGSFSHALTKSELPKIRLQGKYMDFDDITHNTSGGGFSLLRNVNEGGDGTCPITDYIGDGQAIDITPKHIVCNYIIKVK